MISSKEGKILLSKWAEDETLLLCVGKFSKTSFSTTGIVSTPPADTCCVSSVKGEAKLIFRLDIPGLDFEFASRREIQSLKDELPEEIADLGRLVIGIPWESSEGKDLLFLVELDVREISPKW